MMRNKSFIKDNLISLNPHRGRKICELPSGSLVAKDKGTMQKQVRSRSLYDLESLQIPVSSAT